MSAQVKVVPFSDKDIIELSNSTSVGSDLFEQMMKMIVSIGRATKKSAKILSATFIAQGKRFIQWLDEGAETHNRQKRAMDEYYSKNWYFLRSVL